MSKLVENDYARFLAGTKKSQKPLYTGSSRSSLAEKSVTSSKKKTLNQAVLQSRWGDILSRRSNSNLMNRSQLGDDDPIAKVSDITPRRSKIISAVKRRSLKTDSAQRKFNVKDIRKVKTNRNSISMNTGSGFPHLKRNSNLVSNIQSGTARGYFQHRGLEIPTKK